MFCFRVRKLLVPYSEGLLDRKRSESVAKHVGGCSRCASELAAIQSAAQAFRSFKPQAQEPSGDLWARVERQIAETAPAAPRWRPRGLQLAGAAVAATVLIFALVDLDKVSEVTVKPPEQRESRQETRVEQPIPGASSEINRPSDSPAPPTGDAARIPDKTSGASPAGEKMVAAPPPSLGTIPQSIPNKPEGTREVELGAVSPGPALLDQVHPAEMTEAVPPSPAAPADRGTVGAIEKDAGFRAGEVVGASSQHGLQGPAGPASAPAPAVAKTERLVSPEREAALRSRDEGSALAAKGDKDGALKAWRSGLEASPNEDAGILAEAQRARLLDELASHYEKESKGKKSAEASLILARIHERRKEYAKAIEIRRQLSETQPQNARNWLSLGDDLVLIGDFAAANDAFANALKTGDARVQEMARQRQNSPLNQQTPLNEQLRKRG